MELQAKTRKSLQSKANSSHLTSMCSTDAKPFSLLPLIRSSSAAVGEEEVDSAVGRVVSDTVGGVDSEMLQRSSCSSLSRFTRQQRVSHLCVSFINKFN